MHDYLGATALLDFRGRGIQDLAGSRGWAALRERERIRSIYGFVRDEIRFGFNRDDAIPASAVLRDGYGQCNTKSVLFMALLRSAGIPCRLHGFTVSSDLQRGALGGILYSLRPAELVHSWVEIPYRGEWLNIEGFILDSKYLGSVQRRHADCVGGFLGFGIATADLRNPPVDWDENDTYIQKDGIVRDFGVYDSPDEFFREHAQDLGRLKEFLYRNFARRVMNANIERIRRA
jgi:hypothetical protein